MRLTGKNSHQIEIKAPADRLKSFTGGFLKGYSIWHTFGENSENLHRNLREKIKCFLLVVIMCKKINWGTFGRKFKRNRQKF